MVINNRTKFKFCLFELVIWQIVFNNEKTRFVKSQKFVIQKRKFDVAR